MDGKLVRSAIKVSGKTISEIAKGLGITLSHFSRMLKKDVSPEYVLRITRLGVDIPDGFNALNLLAKSGSKKYREKFAEIGINIGESENKDDERREYLKKNHNIVFKNRGMEKGKDIPLLNVEASGGRIDMIKDSPEYITGYYRIPGAKDADVIIRVAGHSMYPDYPDGSMIAVKQIKNFNIIHIGVAHVIVTEEQTFVKLLIKHTDDIWILRSLNKDPRYADFTINTKDILKLYVVKVVINQSEI